MSTATDLAKAEAEAADAENPDEHLVDDGNGGLREETPQEREEREEREAEEGDGDGIGTPSDGSGAVTAAPAMTEQQADRLFKRLETAAQRYLKTAMPITEELGMPVQACPLCTFPGLAIPRQAHEVTSDIEAAVLAMIGKGVEPSYKSSQAYARCEVCDGWGDVLTGAQKDISRTAMCMSCGGKGYVNAPAQIPSPPTPAPVPFPGATLPYTPLPGGVQDVWGRPAGHQHWGLDPAMVGSPNGTQVG